MFTGLFLLVWWIYFFLYFRRGKRWYFWRLLQRRTLENITFILLWYFFIFHILFVLYNILLEHFVCNLSFLYPPLSTGLLQVPFLQAFKVPYTIRQKNVRKRPTKAILKMLSFDYWEEIKELILTMSSTPGLEREKPSLFLRVHRRWVLRISYPFSWCLL